MHFNVEVIAKRWSEKSLINPDCNDQNNNNNCGTLWRLKLWMKDFLTDDVQRYWRTNVPELWKDLIARLKWLVTLSNPFL